MDTSIVGQITEIQSVDDQCLDVTMFMLGTVENESYGIMYSDLDDAEKATVDNFRALVIAKAPSNNP